MKTKKWSIGIGFTSLCNMSCDFCYSKKVRQKANDLPFNTWKDFLDKNKNHIASINYGTGENTLKQEWFDYIKLVKSNLPDIKQALTTNGYLIESIGFNNNKNYFLECINEVDVSIDYTDYKQHNEIRKNPRAYKMAIDSVEFCVKNGIETTIVLCGTESTLQLRNIKSIFQLAYSFGAFVRINIYRRIRENGITPPSFSTIVKALNWIVNNNETIVLSDPLFNSLYNPDAKEISDPSGKSSIRILPTGEITPSTYLVTEEWSAGKIWEENILEKLENSLPFRTLKESNLPQECKSCRYAKSCKGGAFDRRILEFKTLEERDPYCAFRNNNMFKIENKNFKLANSGPSVHGEYLPTLIFKPGKN